VVLKSSFHAAKQYARRICDIPTPTGEQTINAAVDLVAEFSDGYEVTTTRPDRSKIVVSPSGIHACITGSDFGEGHEIVTVFTPGQPVIGCWCELCNVARAPHTKAPGLPSIKRNRGAK